MCFLKTIDWACGQLAADFDGALMFISVRLTEAVKKGREYPDVAPLVLLTYFTIAVPSVTVRFGAKAHCGCPVGHDTTYVVWLLSDCPQFSL